MKVVSKIINNCTFYIAAQEIRVNYKVKIFQTYEAKNFRHIEFRPLNKIN